MWNFFLFVILCINDGKNRNIDEKDHLLVAEAMHPHQWENQYDICKTSQMTQNTFV